MNESRSMTSSVRRVALPLLIAALLVVGTVIFSGSTLIRIEDVTVNRILAGTYGTPDWRVQEMNPLLAQFLTLLYNLAPSVNWYGGLLLFLLFAAAAMGIGLTARKRGGLIPAVIVVSPLVVLLANSVISTAICALCSVIGAFSLMEGLQRKRNGVGRAILGALLFVFGAMLSLRWAIFLGACAVICWLPCAVRESRVRGMLFGLLVLAILSAALFGYSSLMYNSPELSAYRSNYSLFDKLQHSSLKDESDALLAQFGAQVSDTDHASHDHDGDGVPDGEDHVSEEDVVIPENSFDSVGWNLNDASLFFTRYGSDSRLTDPEALRTLDREASYWNFSPSRLFGELYATLRKPQFMLLMCLFVIAALATLVTSHRKGLTVLLASVVAFGGHIVAIARYYDAFADIAPFYLLGLGVLLYFFDGHDAKEWLRRVFSAPWLRIGLSALTLIVFVAAMGGLLYYTRITPANANIYTVEATKFLKPYIAEHPEMLFIGDNPNDRYKPATLVAPVRGEDQNLLAGSYDLYSPRAAALMAAYDITNPLPDSIGNDSIGYVQMAFPEPVTYRLVTEYGIYAKSPSVLKSELDYGEVIVALNAYSQEEIDAILQETADNQQALQEYVDYITQLEEEGKLDEYIDGLNDALNAMDEAPEADAGPTVEPILTPAPAATPRSNG